MLEHYLVGRMLGRVRRIELAVQRKTSPSLCLMNDVQLETATAGLRHAINEDVVPLREQINVQLRVSPRSRF